VKIHDLNSELVARMVTRRGPECSVVSLEEALGCDLVLLATNAGTPYVPMSVRFQPNQLILNISLRDLHPESIKTANNVFDDVEHCLKANTTPHLLEQLNGNRDFVTGTLAEFICSEKQLDPDRPTVFSPFGLGILDLAVAQSLYEHVQASGGGLRVPDFHGDMKR
jgi:ornithine cyclodeaminase